MNVIPISFTIPASGQQSIPFPINGKLIGLTSSFVGSGNTDILITIQIGTVSITDGAINAGIFANLVVPIMFPDYDQIMGVSGSGVITCQNQNTSTQYSFTIVLLVK